MAAPEPQEPLGKFLMGRLFFLWTKLSLGTIVPALPLLIGGFLLAFSITQWFKTGEWHASNGWVIAGWFGPTSWVNAPTNWLGLHKIVKFILDFPLWFSLPAVFYGVVALIASQFNGDAEPVPPTPHDYDRY